MTTPSCPLVGKIIKHWRSNFPKEAAELERHNELLAAAEDAADRASIVLEQCAAKGMAPFEAQELAVEEWGTPPNH